MTQQEFITYAQQGSNSSQVNIWYSDDTTYTIQGITIPTVDINGVSLISFLNQVQQLIVPVQTTQGSVDITLTITTPQVYSNFYFFLITPIQIGQIVVTSFTGTAATVGFSPAYNTVEFGQSPYNILNGTAEDSRKSSYIMASDRYKIGTIELPGYTGPTNIDKLISGSAAKADVQDSNYDNTGWVNARYNGSKSTTAVYKSNPAASGKIFQAAEYPTSSADLIAYQVSSSLVIYSDYFYSGLGDVPGFNSTLIAQYRIAAAQGSNVYSANSTRIFIESTNGDPISEYVPRVGSVLAMDGDSSTDMASGFEQIYVSAVSLYSANSNIYLLQVIRRYDGTTDYAITNPITPASGDRLFTATRSQISQVQGNKIIGINSGLLLVAETGKVLKIGTGGYIVGS